MNNKEINQIASFLSRKFGNKISNLNIYLRKKKCFLINSFIKDLKIGYKMILSKSFNYIKSILKYSLI